MQKGLALFVVINVAFASLAIYEYLDDYESYIGRGISMQHGGVRQRGIIDDRENIIVKPVPDKSYQSNGAADWSFFLISYTPPTI